jgi:hypothetical protein
MAPLSGSSRPTISRKMVDFPQPLGPIKTVVLPASNVRSSGCSALAAPYFLLTPTS